MVADPRLQQFFLAPGQPQQRRYEAIRAIMVDHHPLLDVAKRFGFTYGTLRNYVSHFRRLIRAGQTPPFLSRRQADDLSVPVPLLWTHGLKSPPSPIAVA